MNPTPEPLELVRRYVEGTATADETRALEALLREDPAFRREFLRYTNLDAALGSGRLSATPMILPEPMSDHSGSFRWFQWRPPIAAAAGLVIGMFCTSMVWAYAMPLARLDQPRITPLFSDSFEDVNWSPERGFPTRAGGWFGDLSGSIPGDGEIEPSDGARMVRLTPNPKRNFSFAARIVDLEDYPLPADSESRRIEVTASFHGEDNGVLQRHQIRLAAFSEEPCDVRAIWNGPNMLDEVLQHVGRTVPLKPGEKNRGWRTVEAGMDIPPGARSLVIWVAGVVNDPAAMPTPYLDDVQARFVIEESNP
jgi:hypothetical protein